MGSSPSSIYSRYPDMTSGMYSPSSTTASAMSYMNGSASAYMSSMYGGSAGSPYMAGGGPLSPEEGAEVTAGHPSHSPGSVKSEAGVPPGVPSSGPPTGSSGSGVSMSSGSPGSGGPAPLGVVPPPSGSPATVKREPMSGPPGLSHPGHQTSQDNINRMISMYLPPGDAEAARNGDQVRGLFDVDRRPL